MKITMEITKKEIKEIVNVIEPNTDVDEMVDKKMGIKGKFGDYCYDPDNGKFEININTEYMSDYIELLGTIVDMVKGTVKSIYKMYKMFFEKWMDNIEIIEYPDEEEHTTTEEEVVPEEVE